MKKKLSKKKSIVFFLILISIFIFDLIFISAYDVAYLYKNKKRIDNNVVELFHRLNLTINFIDEKNISRNNLSAYRLLYVGDERFKQLIPVSDYPSVISNYFFGEEWGLTDHDGISKLASSAPLEVKNLGRDIIPVYTQAIYDNKPISIPYYYLDKNNKASGMNKVVTPYLGNDYDYGDVISYANKGSSLVDGKNCKEKICFFGITKSDYWTPQARQLFLDCVNFVAKKCINNNECGTTQVSGEFCYDNDLYVNRTNFLCINPNTALSECRTEVILEKTSECNYGCQNNSCLPQCLDNSQCNVNETCYNNQCLPVNCFDNNDCGNDRFLGETFCDPSNLSVLDKYITFTCNNPGQFNSYCSNMTQDVLKNNCTFGCVNGSCKNCIQNVSISCFGSNLYYFDSCGNLGQLKKQCMFGCENNSCLSERIHDVTLTEFSDSVNKIRLEFVNGTRILNNPANLLCNQEYKIWINVFNNGNFTENVSFNGSIGNLRFNHNPKENLEPQANSLKYKTVNFSELEGSYNITVEAIIGNDRNPMDNFAKREIIVNCVLCYNDTECDDNNSSTQDVCVNPGTFDSFCDNRMILCDNNQDCGNDYFLNQLFCLNNDVYDKFKTFTCNNPGLSNSSCSNTTENRLIDSCMFGCTNGMCLNECESDDDCNEDEVCLNNSCVSVTCDRDRDCGTNGFIGSEFCTENNVTRNYITFTCNNPGRANSYCTNITENRFIENCEFGCLNGMCLNECENNNDCDPNEICINNQCQRIVCTNNQDCGQNRFLNEFFCFNNNSYDQFISFTCNNPGRENSYCVNSTQNVLAEYCDFSCISGECVTCFNNASCGRNGFIQNRYCDSGNVYQNYQEYQCSNPGTSDSDCLSNVYPRLIETCANGCLNGECNIVNITCYNNIDCNDNYHLTFDECNNPGTSLSSCSNTVINCNNDNDCGFSGFYGTEFCLLNDLFKNYQNATCINPSTKDSYCEIVTTQNLILDCGNSYCGPYQENYCRNGDLYKNRLCYNKGCRNNSCFSDPYNDEVLVRDCIFGCMNGACLPECTNSSQCQINQQCINNTCVDIACDSDSDCGTNGFVGDPYCYLNNVVRDYRTFSCYLPNTTLSFCTNSTFQILIETCEFNCSNNTCTEQEQCFSPRLATADSLTYTSNQIYSEDDNIPQLSGSMYRADMLTVAKLCQLKNSSYPIPKSFGFQHGYYSPGDNRVTYWDKTTSRFITTTAEFDERTRSFISEVPVLVCRKKVDNNEKSQLEVNNSEIINYNQDQIYDLNDDVPPVPAKSCYLANIETAQKLCELKGNAFMVSFGDPVGFDTCYNNKVTYWNEDSLSFVTMNACDGEERSYPCINSLQCACL
jgi:hypothetical protein